MAKNKKVKKKEPRFIPEKKGVKSIKTWFCETSPEKNCKCCKPK